MADYTNDSRAVDILNHQQQLESKRAVFDAHWREIAQRVIPRLDDFQRRHRTEGEKRTELIFDSTAPLALDRAASAMESLLVPSSSQWHGLEPEDPSLLDDHDTLVYLGEVTKLLFRLRYRPFANFASQAHESFISLMAFGTQGFFTDDCVGMGMKYSAIPLPELYIEQNQYGIVDYVHRKFPMTARAAVMKFGANLPDKIKIAADKQPFFQFDFIHCVRPNDNVKYGARTHHGMPFKSYYVTEEGRYCVGEGGYRTMPYAVSRHVTSPRETYGRSPAMIVLPDIKMLNEMEKTVIRAAHKIADPPLLVYGDGALNAYSTRPNAINYGGIDEKGNQLVVPMKMGSNLPIVIDQTDQKRKVINDAFLVTLFQILVQNPQMTATEAMLRAQEKGQLLGPTVGRQESEFLGSTIERELDIISAAGVLPPMPPKLRASGGGVRAVYTSPLSRLRRAEDGVAIMRTIESLTPIAQAAPEVMQIWEFDELGFELADINGVPAKVLKSREKFQAALAAAQQAAMDKQVAQTAQSAAGAAKNLGQAAQAASSAGPGIQVPNGGTGPGN